MSHVTTVNEVVIANVAALWAAVECLKARGINCDLVAKTAARMYGGSTRDCELVLKLHDISYDVGFDKAADGTLTPALDMWGGHVRGQLGIAGADGATGAIGQLLREYSKEVVLADAAENGYIVDSCELDEEGQYQILQTVD